MKDIIIKVDSTNSKVFLDKTILSNEMENLQGSIKFEFINGFVDGTAMLEAEYDYIHHFEYQCTGEESGDYAITTSNSEFNKKFTMPSNITSSMRILYYELLEKLVLWENENTYVEIELNGIDETETINSLIFKPITKTYYPLTKSGEMYYIPIYNTLLLQSGRIHFNLRINSENNKVFKSNIFYLEVSDSINAINGDIPREYSSWIDVLNEKILIIDSKLQQVDSAITETNNLNLDVSKSGKIATVTLTKKDNTTKTVTLSDGTSLMFNWDGTKLGIKTDEDSDYVYVDLQGIQGEKGDTGAPFTIKKTYTSVAEMNADFDNMEIGDYVMIASSVEIEDNAKLYTKGQSAWIFITDFSGATGIQGETGATPNIQIGTVITGNTSSVTRTGTNENPVLNFVLEKGEQGNSIEFNWNGTQLGVRVEGESQYEYVDLKGATGETGQDGADGFSPIANVTQTQNGATISITDETGTTTANITNGEVSQAQLDYYKTILNALPKVTQEATEIELNNTAKSPMEIELEPNTSQNTTTGKNLLNNTNGSSSQNGITFTKNSDGTITLNGTATSTAYYNITPQTLPAGSYILSGTPEGSGTSTYRIIANYDGYKVDYGSGVNIILSEETTPTEFYIIVNSGVTANSVVFKPMIRLASITDATYESYTGGKASPSSDFPQQVHKVTGNNSIKKVNKNWAIYKEVNNLLDYNNIINSNSTGEAKKWWDNISNLPKDTTLIGSWDFTTDGTVISNVTGIRIVIYYTDGTEQRTEKGTSFTIPSSKIIRELYVYGGQFATTNKWSNIQIEKGSSATSFVEHQEESYSITLGDLEYCEIGDYKDKFFKNTIDSEDYDSALELDKWYLKKYTRHLSLAIADMDNDENYPGWKNLSDLLNDYPDKNTLLSNFTDYMCNITNNNNAISVNTVFLAGGGTLFFNTGTIALTQTQWKEQYPNLVMDLIYGLQTPYNILLNNTLQAELDAIYYNQLAYQDQTNISQTNADLPFVISASAIRDMSDIFSLIN